MAMADPPPPVADGAPPTGFAAAAAADMGHPQVGQGGGVAIAGGSGRGGGWERSCRCLTPSPLWPALPLPPPPCHPMALLHH
jgi:hypothetical protein